MTATTLDLTNFQLTNPALPAPGRATPPVQRSGRPRRGSTRNAWQLLSVVAPELAEWAAYFASCSDTRAAAEAGIARLVGQRDADDLLRQAEQFVALVGEVLPLR